MLINTSAKIHLLIAFLSGLWLTLFLVFVGPFDSAELSMEWRALVMYRYGLVLFGSYALIIPFQPAMSRLVKGRVFIFESLSIGIILIICMFGSWEYYTSSIINGDFSFSKFVFTIYLPTVLIFAPILAFGRWVANKRAKPAKAKSQILTEQQQLEILKPKILKAIGEKIYLDSNLNLQEFAAKLGTNSKTLSSVINQGFQLNFNDFINAYRIESVLKTFKEGDHKKHTLQGIAENCGFNSKATFNRAFRKKMNISPSEYLKSLDNK